MTAATSTPKVPRLAGPPLLGLNLRLLRDPLGMFTQARQRCGDLVELDLGLAGPVYAAFHPDGVKQVVHNGRRTHRQLLRELLGKGLFTTPSGADWLRRRRLLQPLFRPQRLAAMVPLLLTGLDRALDRRWLAGRRIDLAAELKHANVAMMVDATFGQRPDVDTDTANRALSFLLGYVDHQLFSLLKPPRRWPTRSNRRYRSDIAALRGVIGDAIVALRRRPGDQPTFLDGLLSGQATDHPDPFTDDELVDEVLSIFIAGTETTGTALTWALHLVRGDQDSTDRLRAEVAATVGDRAPTATDLAAMAMPRAVVNEALRLYPPAWALRRVLAAPTRIAGTELPADARVLVSSYVTHRHPDVWPEPERFRPDRWLPDLRGNPPARPLWSYFPFGAGAHQCAGNAFALLQGDLVLTRVTQRYRLSPDTGGRLRARPAIALAPVPGPTALVSPA